MFIYFFIVVFLHKSVQCASSRKTAPEDNDTVFVTFNNSDEKQEENDVLGMNFMRNVFLQLSRNPNDQNIAIVKALLKILIAQKQNEERINNYWNLRHG